jgi:hypothetical protein
MGNYSWILQILNCKNTIIDWITIIKEYSEIIDEYKYNEDDLYKIKSLYEFFIGFHDTKLFGYFNNKLSKFLCKVCLHTSFIDQGKSNNNPRVYFEEEGWDRIHYLEFQCGTEKVFHGSHAFNFNHLLWTRRILEEQSENKDLPCDITDNFDSILQKEHHIFESMYKDSDTNYDIYKKIINSDNEIYELIHKKTKDYMLNLIDDKFTNWSINELNYNRVNLFSSINFMNAISGIREEDIELDKLRQNKL